MTTPIEEQVLPEKILQIVDGNQRENKNPARKMHKVPPWLRLDKNNQQDYDPMVVSLGPYHHGKEDLQLAEEFKRTALQLFVDGSGHDASFFYLEVLKHVDDARNCYIEDSTKEYDNPTFAQMMLLDACFIIDFIVRGTSDTNFFVFRDLNLLENQIPFSIVKLLMSLRYGKLGEEILMANGIASRDEKLPPLHLLDALWQFHVREYQKDMPTTSGPNPISNKEHSRSGCLKDMGNLAKCSRISQCISKFLRFPRRKGNKVYNSDFHCFRSASDLKAKGIHFRPITSGSLKGIKFKSGYFYALLEVPIWHVTIHTKVFFLNMIAYEMCQATGNDRAVTAYIEFMKSLIDIPKDVKELREKRILITSLGSDEEVVKVFKEINTCGVNMFPSIFDNVKDEIQAHYDNRAKTWLAELFYTYFRTPWTALALFAATVLLVLTFLQTYYTMRPS